MLLLLLLRLLLSLFFSCCCCGYLSSRCVSRSTTIALHFNRKKRCCYFSGNAAVTVQSVADSATAIAVSLSVAVAVLVQASSEKAPRSLKKPWEQIVAVTVDVTADAAVSVAVDVAFAFAVAVAVAVLTLFRYLSNARWFWVPQLGSKQSTPVLHHHITTMF